MDKGPWIHSALMRLPLNLLWDLPLGYYSSHLFSFLAHMQQPIGGDRVQYPSFCVVLLKTDPFPLSALYVNKEDLWIVHTSCLVWLRVCHSFSCSEEKKIMKLMSMTPTSYQIWVKIFLFKLWITSNISFFSVLQLWYFVWTHTFNQFKWLQIQLRKLDTLLWTGWSKYNRSKHSSCIATYILFQMWYSRVARNTHILQLFTAVRTQLYFFPSGWLILKDTFLPIIFLFCVQTR